MSILRYGLLACAGIRGRGPLGGAALGGPKATVFLPLERIDSDSSESSDLIVARPVWCDGSTDRLRGLPMSKEDV